jgi:hypothetical protein
MVKMRRQVSAALKVSAQLLIKKQALDLTP